jgi:hypothetical protein
VSAWLNPKFDEKPLVVNGSTYRAEVKFVIVGSRIGFAGFATGPWLILAFLDAGK